MRTLLPDGAVVRGEAVAVVPRGEGTGLAGGAVPHGGVVLSTERLRQRRSLESLYWGAHLEAA